MMATGNMVLDKFYGCVATWNELQQVTATGLLRAGAGFVSCDEDYIRGIFKSWQKYDCEEIATQGIMAAVPVGVFFTDPTRAATVAGLLAMKLGKGIYGRLNYALLAYLTAILVQRKQKNIGQAFQKSLLYVCTKYLHKGVARVVLQNYIYEMHAAVFKKLYRKVKGQDMLEMMLLVDALSNACVATQTQEGYEASICLAKNLWGAWQGYTGAGNLALLHQDVQALTEDLYYKAPYPDEDARMARWKKLYVLG